MQLDHVYPHAPPLKPGSHQGFGNLCLVLEPRLAWQLHLRWAHKLESALLFIRLQTASQGPSYPCKTKRTSFPPYGPAGITWGWNMETGFGRTTCQRCTMHDTTAPRRLCTVSFSFKSSFRSLSSSSSTAPGPGHPLSLPSPIAPPTTSSHHDAVRQWLTVNGLAVDTTGLAATTCSCLGIVAARLRAGHRRRQHRTQCNLQRGNLTSVEFRAASRDTFHTDPPRLARDKR